MHLFPTFLGKKVLSKRNMHVGAFKCQKKIVFRQVLKNHYPLRAEIYLSS